VAYLKPAAGAAREGRSNAGVPGAGTDEVQTITFGGTPTGGTFRLSYKGRETADITWTATDATLVSRIDTALGALSTIGGASNVTVAAGTLSSGIGAGTITFVVANGKKAVPLITVTNNSLTGTSPTVAVTETTPGVTAAHRGAAKGAVVMDISNGVPYVNTGTAVAPTWTKVGGQ
jgi:hypothetical protein